MTDIRAAFNDGYRHARRQVEVISDPLEYLTRAARDEDECVDHPGFTEHGRLYARAYAAAYRCLANRIASPEMISSKAGVCW